MAFPDMAAISRLQAAFDEFIKGSEKGVCLHVSSEIAPASLRLTCTCNHEPTCLRTAPLRCIASVLCLIAVSHL